MSRPVSIRIALFALLASTLLLSGQTCDEGTAGQCVPGRVVPCPCPGGTDGIQECQDNKTYGACVCADAGGGEADATADDATVPDDTGDDATVDTGSDATEQTLPYRYVRVIDESNASSGDTPGADIDAVEIVKQGGDSFWAAVVSDYNIDHRETSVDAVIPDDVLGLPDSVSLDGSTCDPEEGFFSLGGSPGYVTVAFTGGVELEPGDVVNVYEVGNCDFSGGTAPAEEISVAIGTSPDPDHQWSPIVDSGLGPIVSGTVTSDDVPPVSAD